jgi:non-specific serine/threonine protein kinase
MLSQGGAEKQRGGVRLYGAAPCLAGIAGTAAALGQPKRAATLFGAVDAFCAANGVSLSPSDRAANERDLTAVRARLGEAAFAATWESGRAMPLEHVIAVALDADPDTLPAAPAVPGAAAVGLTAREAEVLRLLAQGLTDRDIAAALFLSPRTIGGHVTNLLAKLHLESRTAAAVFAHRHGLA